MSDNIRRECSYQFFEDSAERQNQGSLSMKQLEHRLSLISLDLFKKEEEEEEDVVVCIRPEAEMQSQQVEGSADYHLSKMNLYLDSLLEELNSVLAELRQMN